MVKEKFGIDKLEDYVMFEQVQMAYNKGGDYFIADQVLVKYGTKISRGAEIRVVEDMVVIENKLSFGTELTTNQRAAKKISKYTVRGDRLGVTDAAFKDGNIKWVKVYDSGDGKAISGLTTDF